MPENLTDERGTVEAFDLAGWHKLMEVNPHGVAHTVRAAAKPVKQRRSGSIVVTASTVGPRVDPYVSSPYAVAKAGIVNLVRQAALDLARWQVRVNAIAPGPFRTNIGGGGLVDRQAREAKVERDGGAPSHGPPARGTWARLAACLPGVGRHDGRRVSDRRGRAAAVGVAGTRALRGSPEERK
jgi:NAD(P)-dependent dehydrogenase (short-subunit alcohol dehydrogenase family)